MALCIRHSERSEESLSTNARRAVTQNALRSSQTRLLAPLVCSLDGVGLRDPYFLLLPSCMLPNVCELKRELWIDPRGFIEEALGRKFAPRAHPSKIYT